MTAIEFEHVSKQYRLGVVSTRTLSHDLNRWWQTAVLRHEDPYLKISETNDRATAGHSEYVWALKDIDFKVEQGDVVGIIGKNGAGKSTLLKLLSRVTAPTTGIIRARGRIASLLEVGTGFHPEMTGRENIYMNGAIMGMTKQDITRKLDEIIAFSGCERYIDTPVKRYSSGMTVRLGFAIAAHLEPEILVVDEVLAVGDAEFQKKAIGKMQDVAQGEGRTVLFVSHNMGSISRLCQHTVLLENGKVKMMGNTAEIVSAYLHESLIGKICRYEAKQEKRAYLKWAQLRNQAQQVTDTFRHDEDLYLEMEVANGTDIVVQCSIEVFDTAETLIMVERFPVKPTQGEKVQFKLPMSSFVPNNYTLGIDLYIYGLVYDMQKGCLSFTIVDTEGLAITENGDVQNGVVLSTMQRLD